MLTFCFSGRPWVTHIHFERYPVSPKKKLANSSKSPYLKVSYTPIPIKPFQGLNKFWTSSRDLILTAHACVKAYLHAQLYSGIRGLSYYVLQYSKLHSPLFAKINDYGCLSLLCLLQHLFVYFLVLFPKFSLFNIISGKHVYVFCD